MTDSKSAREQAETSGKRAGRDVEEGVPQPSLPVSNRADPPSSERCGPFCYKHYVVDCGCIVKLRSELVEAEGFLSNLIYSSPSPNWLREKGYGDFPGILEQVKEFLARSKKEKGP